MVVRGAKYPRKPNEFYSTPPETVRVILDTINLGKQVCDPACGDGAIIRVLKEYDYKAVGADIDNGYDFLKDQFRWKNVSILTNPPFGPGGRTAVDFIARALDVTKPWFGDVAMLLPVDFDSGITRRHLFGGCPAFQLKLVLLNRIRWFNGQSGSTNHAWFIWDHAYADKSNEPRLKYAAQKYPGVLD